MPIDITKKELNQMLVQQRRRMREERDERDRLRHLKDVEAKIKSAEPELEALQAKLERLYQRRAKLTTNELGAVGRKLALAQPGNGSGSK